MSSQISFDANSINSLFDDAVTMGNLTPQAAQIMVANIDGNMLAGAGGAGIDSLATDDVVLLQFLIDMSGSMGSVQMAVIKEINKLFKALRSSKVASSILVSAWVFNTNPNLLFSWTKLEDVVDLTTKQYHPNGGTSLFDAAIQSLSSMSAYAHTLASSGLRVRGVNVILSDGADTSSSNSKASVKIIADNLIKQESNTLAFGGFGDLAFMKGLAQDMGYPAVWINDSKTEKEIRALLELVSGSVIQGSMGNGNNFNNQFFASVPTTP